MAMLAGPRQRKRYNLVPKGKALFEDGDRFGTKMLEKMGWTKGKGLGSKENGQQEFIRIRYKNDANGLGYEDRDDQWTEHEKHFNGLLESLHAGDSNSNTASVDDEDECTPRAGFGSESRKTSKEKLKDKFSGQSLEERSKKSKARVHYKKFTKGKDMSQYSEKDLANIFGKKATAEENDFYSQLPSFNAGNKDSGEETEKTSAFELGTHTINTGLSVEDYFKMKMEALKKKNGAEGQKEEVEGSANGSEDIAQDTEAMDESAESKKKKKKNKKKHLECEAENGNGSEVKSVEDLHEELTVENGGEEVADVKTKKMKKRKASLCGIATEVITVEDEAIAEQRPQKKKKKASAEKDGSGVTDKICIPKETTNELKTGKETLCQNEIDCAEILTVEDDTNEEQRPKKKKKKKSTEEDKIEEESKNPIENQIEEKKKKKKSVDNSVLNEVTVPEKENLLTPERRFLTQSGIDCAGIIEVVDEGGEEKHSKKKKKRALQEKIDLTSQTNALAHTKEEISGKITKENKAEQEDTLEKLPLGPVADKETQNRKKNKKRKHEEDEEKSEVDVTAIPSKKKKTNDTMGNIQSLATKTKKKAKSQTTFETPAIQNENRSTMSKKNNETPSTTNLVKVSSLNDCCLDTYKISTFCAEKFRNVDLESFKGSNISQQNGYGLSENLQLKVVNINGDQERITKLWSGTSNKYKEDTPKQEIYRNYMKKVKQARIQKKKIPKMKVKSIQRLNAFKPL